MKDKKAANRIQIVAIFLFIGALCLAARLYYVQIVKHEYFSTQGVTQYSPGKSDVVERGDIIVQSKDLIETRAAYTEEGFLVAINPRFFEPNEESLSILETALGISKEFILARDADSKDPYEVLLPYATSTPVRTLREAKIPGLLFEDADRRVYGGVKMPHIVGFVGYKDNERVGRAGLELEYNDTLRKDETHDEVNVFAEIFANIGDRLTGAEKSADLLLTIETFVQEKLARTLEEVVEEWQSEITGGIIMDPKTGRVIALSGFPDFDPNEYSGITDVSYFKNPLVENVYELGSILKPLTMAAAIDAGAVTRETTYYDAGYIDIGEARINNFDRRGRGYVSMQKVLNESLNTGVAFAVQKMGYANFRKAFENFGFTEKTLIDLPNEAENLSASLKRERPVELVTASFGQGIAMTPISLVRAFTAIANGGVMVRPYVVDTLRYEDGTEKVSLSSAGAPVIKKETAEEVSRMLVEVVDTSLLGGSMKHEGYSIAAKTGTAQIPNPATGKYYDDRFLHSFVGYFPAYDPQFLVFLFTKNPQNATYAAYTLTPAFFEIADFLIEYYQVPPDR